MNRLQEAPHVGLLAGINVGFDLHDTFVDVLIALQSIIHLFYGVMIPLEKLRKEQVLAERLLTIAQWNRAMTFLFEEPHFFKQVQSIPGAAKRLIDMHRQQATLTAITASGKQAERNIRLWDKHHGEISPYARIVSSGRRGNKASYAKHFRLHYFSDNKLKNLTELRRIVPRLCFFIRPNNWHEQAPAKRMGAKLIASWDEYYQYMIDDAPRLREELEDATVARRRVPISTTMPKVDIPRRKCVGSTAPVDPLLRSLLSE